MRGAVLLVMIAGCGRLSFDPLSSAASEDATRFDTGGTLHTGRPNVMILGVQGAFSTTMFDAWIVNRANNRQSIAGTTVIDDATFANTDVVLLLSPQKTYAMAESTAIANVVARGGSLLAITGFQNGFDLPRFNSALASLGVQGSAMTTFSGQVTDLPAHPVTTGVSSLPYTGGYEIMSLSTVVHPVGRANNVVVGGAFEHQAGRVMVWGDEYVTYDSDWDGDVQLFWDNALAWAWPTQ